MAKLPFNADLLSPKDKLIYESMVSERKKMGAPFDGPYAALMNHPELCQKIEALGGYLKFHGHLARDVYQFVVLSVASSTQSAFEWVDHVQHALEAGVPQSVVDMIKAEGIAHPLPEPYQLAAQILTATLRWKNIPADIQQKAIDVFGMLGFVEIVVLSGFYQMFSAINQGFDVPLRPGEKDPWKA